MVSEGANSLPADSERIYFRFPKAAGDGGCSPQFSESSHHGLNFYAGQDFGLVADRSIMADDEPAQWAPPFYVGLHDGDKDKFVTSELSDRASEQGVSFIWHTSNCCLY